MKKYKKYIKAPQFLTWIAVIVIMGVAGCKKAIDVGTPKTQINSANVFNSNTTAEGAVSGIFASLSSSGNMYNGGASITLQQGLAADELVSYTTVPNQFYINQLTNQGTYYWREIFNELFLCNSAISGLTASTSLTPAIQQQLLGEVKFARAFIFFNAVNLYGDMPLVLGTDPAVNNVISRSPAADVLKQVVQDLTDAQALLPDNKYLSFAGAATTDRSLPNKQAVNALLARVYLYMQDWKNAETQASNVISASSYLLEPVLTNVFLKTSRETVWQLQSTSTIYANADAYQLIPIVAPNGVANQYLLSSNLVNAFESGDNRFVNWVGKLPSGTTTFYYAYKYKQAQVTAAANINEYPIMFRLAEQYLIRAEARAQQNNVSGSQSDLNAVRSRAGLTGTTSTTQANLLTAIYRERQVELFTEFGHRWFDLKRTGQLNAVMSVVAPQKGGTWSPFKALVPIPASELVLNSHLVQNPGY